MAKKMKKKTEEMVTVHTFYRLRSFAPSAALRAGSFRA